MLTYESIADALQLDQRAPGSAVERLANRSPLALHDYVVVTMDMSGMRISAGEFKARCLKLMERVARTRESIIITKRGKPVAKLAPLDEEAPRQPLFGCMAGTVRFEGDVVSSADQDWAVVTGEEDDLYAVPPATPTTHRVADAPRKPRRR